MDQKLKELEDKLLARPIGDQMHGVGIRARLYRRALADVLTRPELQADPEDLLTSWNLLSDAWRLRRDHITRAVQMADRIGIRELGRRSGRATVSPVSRGIWIIQCPQVLAYPKSYERPESPPCGRKFFCPFCWCREVVTVGHDTLLSATMGRGAPQQEARCLAFTLQAPLDPDPWWIPGKLMSVTQSWARAGIHGGATRVTLAPSVEPGFVDIEIRHLVLAKDRQSKRFFLYPPHPALSLPGTTLVSRSDDTRPIGRFDHRTVEQMIGWLLRWPAGWLRGDLETACRLFTSRPHGTDMIRRYGDLLPATVAKRRRERHNVAEVVETSFQDEPNESGVEVQ